MRTTISVLCVMYTVLMGLCPVSAARKKPKAPLTAQGEKLKAKYAGRLESLKKEVAASLPAVDEKKKAAFLGIGAALRKIKKPAENAGAIAKKQYEQLKKTAEFPPARAVLDDVDSFLGSDKLDNQLMELAVLTEGTPHGLAEFAQQGKEEEALLDRLFADKALMKQALVAAGANGSEWGEAMQVYTAILAKSERAREVGTIFQRLALGTALHQSWLKGKERGGVYGMIRKDSSPDQVSRYLHYEKAYLDGELDPAFKDMTVFECRFITNDGSSDAEIAWVRKMMRNYRPDHITRPDYKWRYTFMVKTDVPYTSTRHDPTLGMPAQYGIALGGVCGRRAQIGRLVTRAFGIPARPSTQKGHGAMCHWTPDGWVICLGAWWSNAWCGPVSGMSFLLDSLARRHPEEYIKVLRAEWVDYALREDVPSGVGRRTRGGFWNSLARYKKRLIVEDHELAKFDGNHLAKLTAEEGQKLGDSKQMLEGDVKDEVFQVPEKDRKIIVGDDSVITIPAAACVKPTNSTDQVLFIKNLKGEVQLHYAGVGKRPEIMKYYVQMPKAGKYALTAHVVTVVPKQSSVLRLNRRTLVNIDLPYSRGMWQDTKPVVIELQEGRNSLMFTRRVPCRGVAIKRFKPTPVGK